MITSAIVVFGPIVAYLFLWPALKWVANFFLPPPPTVYERLTRASQKAPASRPAAHRKRR